MARFSLMRSSGVLGPDEGPPTLDMEGGGSVTGWYGPPLGGGVRTTLKSVPSLGDVRSAVAAEAVWGLSGVLVPAAARELRPVGVRARELAPVLYLGEGSRVCE